MIEKYTASGGSSSRDKKLHQEALTMLSDAKRKIEYLRMQLLLLRNKKPESSGSDKGLQYWTKTVVFFDDVSYILMGYFLSVLAVPLIAVWKFCRGSNCIC
jgi:hypothetical protein